MWQRPGAPRETRINSGCQENLYQFPTNGDKACKLEIELVSLPAPGLSSGGDSLKAGNRYGEDTMHNLAHRAVESWLLVSTLLFGLVATQVTLSSLQIAQAEPRIPPQVQRPPDMSIERIERPERIPKRKAGQVDINSASVETLQTLPGIGEVSAKKIIEGRPYKHTDELVLKKILPQVTFDQIKDNILAEQK